MTNGIIDFMKHYKDKLETTKKEVGDQSSKGFEKLSTKLNQSDDEIERLTLLYSFSRYSLFFNCLFYNNHKSNNDIKAAFLTGFKEEHLDQIQDKVCYVLDKFNRSFVIVNARMKTYLGLAEELTMCYFKSKREASKEIENQFLRSDKVFVIRELSGAKIDSKGPHLRSLIKIS